MPTHTLGKMKAAQKISESSAENKNALERWRHLYDADMRAVDELILSRARDERVPLIGEMTFHILASGGKRLRPILTLLCARLCEYQGKHHITLAAAIECIHTATLLHDDVVDESALRRGQATANECWGNQASVLVGDFLLSRAFQLMSETGNIRVLQLLSDASVTISRGEIQQLSAQRNLATDQNEYLSIITAKTAELFATGCAIGAVIAERSPAEERALDAYGRALGIAFQIVDDILDYSAAQEKLGKTIGDDFREGKITLPVILAYRDASKTEKEFWQRTLVEDKQGDGDLIQAIALIQSHKALTRAMDIAGSYARQAVEALNIFKDSDQKMALADLAYFATQRPY